MVKVLVQNLRTLITGRTGPTGLADQTIRSAQSGEQTTGPPASWTDKEDAATQRARRLENEAATTLAPAGYQVQQLGGKNPDFRIEGKIFDCVPPESENPSSSATSSGRWPVPSSSTATRAA